MRRCLDTRVAIAAPARCLVDLGGRCGLKHMLDYLVARPEKGLLAYEMGIPTIVQHWRSFDQLKTFAKARLEGLTV